MGEIIHLEDGRLSIVCAIGVSVSHGADLSSPGLGNRAGHLSPSCSIAGASLGLLGVPVGDWPYNSIPGAHSGV